MGLVIQLIQTKHNPDAYREVLDVLKLPLDVCGCFFQPFSEYIDRAFEYFPLGVASLLLWFVQCV